jgi:polysaccharide deacetylase family protein (PEP-CTERM system associated)
MNPVSLTFDVEDWSHPELVRALVPPGDTRTVVVEGTERILELLRRHRARASFFVLGDVAAKHPALVRRIADEGHEIASHGYSHTPLWKLDRESFRSELRGFREAIRAALGADPALGFRAPTFSLDRSTAWGLEVLREEGFAYDSSIFPLRTGLYGIAGAPRGIYRPAATDLTRHDPEGELVEFPVAVHDWAGISVPVAGGFYLRALPARVFEGALAGFAARRPANLFLHPWECVSEVPRVPLGPVHAFVTYTGLDSVLPKLERLVKRFGSVPMLDILEQGGYLRRAA